MQNVSERKALVIGAGIAGLLTARVLSDYYQVLVIERDTFSERPGPRRGTPQDYHLHRLLGRGKIILQHLFPSFIESLLDHGAYPLEKKKALMFVQDESIVLTYSDKDAFCSRALLEHEMRQRVQALPSVRFLTNLEVIGLETDFDRARVTGIQLRKRGQEERTTIMADLVVDASGRTSKLTQWLEALGYELPENEQVHASIGYSTRYYQASPTQDDEWSGFLKTSDRSAGGMGAAAVRIENDNWVAILVGQGGQYPSTDATTFEQQLAFCIGSHQLAGILQGAQPLAEPRGYRVPVCIRQHFEQMDQWPGGLLVLGDALCSLDPIYGQGMTVASMEVETLATCLREQQSHPQPAFEREVLQRMQEVIDPAWWLSSIADLRARGVTHTGPYQLKEVQMIQMYLDVYLKYALRHKEHLFKYTMMNGLLISPREVINSRMLATLLESEAAGEEQRLFAQLFQGSPQHFAEILDEIVPAFSLAFVGESLTSQ